MVVNHFGKWPLAKICSETETTGVIFWKVPSISMGYRKYSGQKGISFYETMKVTFAPNKRLHHFMDYTVHAKGYEVGKKTLIPRQKG